MMRTINIMITTFIIVIIMTTTNAIPVSVDNQTSSTSSAIYPRAIQSDSDENLITEDSLEITRLSAEDNADHNKNTVYFEEIDETTTNAMPVSDDNQATFTSSEISPIEIEDYSDENSMENSYKIDELCAINDDVPNKNMVSSEEIDNDLAKVLAVAEHRRFLYPFRRQFWPQSRWYYDSGLPVFNKIRK